MACCHWDVVVNCNVTHQRAIFKKWFRGKNAIGAIFYIQPLTSQWQHICLAADPVMALCVIRACSGGAYCLCKPCGTMALISQMHSNDWTYLVQTKTCKMSAKQRSMEHEPTRNQHLKPPTTPSAELESASCHSKFAAVATQSSWPLQSKQI